MNTESEPLYEQTAADLLKQIELNGNYLFHGSPAEVVELKPNIPEGDLSDKSFNKTESVFATSSAARAVISAIMPKGKNIKWGTLQDDEGNVTLQCSSFVLNQVKPGYVYVMGDKEKAEKDEDGPSHQYKYNSAQEPKLVIPVTIDDFVTLGGKIEIIQ